jgi:hypothetical protein
MTINILIVWSGMKKEAKLAAGESNTAAAGKKKE